MQSEMAVRKQMSRGNDLRGSSELIQIINTNTEMNLDTQNFCFIDFKIYRIGMLLFSYTNNGQIIDAHFVESDLLFLASQL